MLFISENILSTFLILFIVIAILIWHKTTFNRLKQTELNKLKLLSLEIQREKNITKNLDKVPLEIKKLKNKTNKKILQINVDIMNVDFSLNEVLN